MFFFIMTMTNRMFPSLLHVLKPLCVSSCSGFEISISRFFQFDKRNREFFAWLSKTVTCVFPASVCSCTKLWEIFSNIAKNWRNPICRSTKKKTIITTYHVPDYHFVLTKCEIRKSNFSYIHDILFDFGLSKEFSF